VDGTNFKIPDLRGKTLVQAGSLLGTDRSVGDTVGSEDVDLSGVSFTATVNHSSSDEAGSTFVLKSATVPTAATDTDVIQISNNASGDSKNVQPSFVTRYIIKT
jgi:microcystin-dependent protein